MKKIEAIIRHSKLDDVKDALNEHQVQGMTITEVRGCGHQPGTADVYRGTVHVDNYRPKLKLELVVPDRDAPVIVTTIIEAAQTGEVGDGKVFVSDLSAVIRIRTGEAQTVV